MNHPYFQTGPIGVQVGNMHGVAVTAAGRVEPLAVVIDDAGAVNDLILAVAIDVGDGELVVALSAVFLVAGRAVVAVKHPAFRELAVAPIVSGQHGAGVITATHHDARVHAVEVSHAGKETVDAVAVVVAPIGDLAARRIVIGGGESGAGPAVEDREVFRSVEDIARTAAGRRFAALVERAGGAFGADVVGLRVADDFADTVDRAVGGFADNLGAAVAVEVVDHELRIMRALADIFAEVDFPEERAVELVGLQNRRIGDAGLRVVAALAGLVQHDLVFAIAVEVADRDVARRVARGRAQRDGKIGQGQRPGGQRERRARRLLDAVEHRAHEIGGLAAEIGRGVHEIRRARDRLAVQLDRFAGRRTAAATAAAAGTATATTAAVTTGRRRTAGGRATRVCLCRRRRLNTWRATYRRRRRRRDVAGRAGIRTGSGSIWDLGTTGRHAAAKTTHAAGAALGFAVEVEGDVLRVRAEQSPADEDLAVGLMDGHDATAEVFHLSLRPGERSGGEQGSKGDYRAKADA